MPKRIQSRPFGLADVAATSIHPVLDVPEGWEPRPNVALDRALPAPWDAAYVKDHGQPFQPVKLWRNAVMLSRFVAQSPTSVRADKARVILSKLVDRMREFTVTDGNVRFIENRFSFTDHGHNQSAPWVSAICNAFAILACDRISDCLPDVDVLADIKGYAAAFHTIHHDGMAPPDRWITYCNTHGYIWFDEYPRAAGQPTLVLNGHIYSVLALRSAHDHDPEAGHDDLARAGAATVESYLPWFRIPHNPNLYSLNGLADAQDYLPQRTVRQLYQLNALTGEDRFGRYAQLIAQDATDHVGVDRIAKVVSDGRIVRGQRAKSGLLHATPQAAFKLRRSAYLPKPPALGFVRWLRWRLAISRYN